MTYYIKSEKGFWKKDALGYTDDEKKAGTFSFKTMHDLGLNLDNCTLIAASQQQRTLVKIEDETPAAWH